MKFALRLLIFFMFTVIQPAVASLPPTTTKGQFDTSKTTTFNFQAPAHQITKTDSITGLIETGNYNLLKNPGFESTTFSDGWFKSVGPTWTEGSGSDVAWGTKSMVWDAAASGQFLHSTQTTIPPKLYGKSGQATCSIRLPSGSFDGVMRVWDFATWQSSDVSLSGVSSDFKEFTVPFLFPSSGSIGISFESGSSHSAIAIDDCYLGPAKNVVNAAFSTPTVAYSPALTSSGGGAVTLNATGVYGPFGKWWRSADRIYFEIDFRNGSGGGASGSAGALRMSLPPGYIPDTSKMSLTGAFGYSMGMGSFLTGSTLVAEYPITYDTGTNTISIFKGPATGYIQVSDIIASAALSIKGSFPCVGCTASDAVTADQQRVPKVTVYTSGSGTFMPSNGATYMHVMVVGGGGGGSGSGSSGAGAGGNGGNSTFGSSLLTASGGTGSDAGGIGGAGGGTTINSPAVTILNVTGGDGGVRMAASTSINFYLPFAYGGANPLGGAGIGGSGSGGNARLNTGGGGAGGRADAGGTNSSGGGGGAGGYIEALISNPSGSYSYAVGTGGSPGSAGTGGHGGGAGAAGRIVVTEYFGATTAILANSVTTSRQNGERIERANINCAAASSISSQSGFVTGLTNISSGTCTPSWSSTTWSGPPSCTATISYCSASSGVGCFAAWIAGPNTTTGQLRCLSDTGALCTEFSANLLCMGPR